jgi:hypothetical protein
MAVVTNSAVVAGTEAEGAADGGWDHDVFCISAGANKAFDTPFVMAANRGTIRAFDDFVYIIQGATR